MKKINLALLPVGVLAILLMAVSCDSDSEQGISASRDCIVTSASLGVLKRVMHTQDKAGNDSVYEVNVTGAYYPLHIDHLGGRIFNTDSLPVGTDLRRTVFSVFNTQGNVGIRSLVTGNDTVFNKADSTDCSVERELTVYAADGVSRRTYRLSLCAHREEADSFVWKQVCAADARLARLAPGHRTFVAAGTIHVFGTMDGQPMLVAATTEEPASWMAWVQPAGLDVGSVCRFGGRYLALVDGRIAVSTLSGEWTDAGSDFRPDKLVGAATTRVFAVKDGRFYSSADGVTWTADEADALAQVPVGGAVSIVQASLTDKTFENVLAVGRKADATAVVWCRDMDLSGEMVFPWSFLPPVTDEVFRCPSLTAPSLAAYDGGAVLAGNKADGTVAPLYVSRDNGRTWRTGEFANPLAGKAFGVSMAVDEDNFVWIVGGGQVWRGRINRLGWAEVPEIFE